MMKIFRKKRAQNVAEYAILIALVVGAIIAIQTFAKRTLQARVRDASQYMTKHTDFGAMNVLSGKNYLTGQYEPYYQNSQYETTKEDYELKYGNGSEESYAGTSNTIRNEHGYSNVIFNASANVTNGMTF